MENKNKSGAATFGERLRSLRAERSLTQGGLAKLVHVARLTISNYEQNRREPDFDTLCSFADFFGCSADFLLGRSDFRDVTDAARHGQLMPEAEALLLRLSPAKRDFITLLLTEQLKNHAEFKGSKHYAETHLYSTLSLNVSANTLSSLLDEFIGIVTEMNEADLKKTMKTLSDRAYAIKLDMVKTADTMHTAFIAEAGKAAERAGIDAFPDPDASGTVRSALEEIFRWGEKDN